MTNQRPLALVTGASKGIGRAIAVTLAAIVPALAVVATAWALAVSTSRVVLGVHYPLDVFAGAALSFFCLDLQAEHAPAAIAKRLQKPLGEVELILNLQRITPHR